MRLACSKNKQKTYLRPSGAPITLEGWVVRKVEGRLENRQVTKDWDGWGILVDRQRKWRWFGPTLSGLIGGHTFSVLLSFPWRQHQDPFSYQWQKCHFQFQTARASGRNDGKEGHTTTTVLGLQGSADSSPCHAWGVTPGSSTPCSRGSDKN